MRKLLIAATAFGAITWAASASAEPVQMTDTELTAVTAGTGVPPPRPCVWCKPIPKPIPKVIINTAIATNTSTVIIVGSAFVAVKVIQVAVANAGNH